MASHLLETVEIETAPSPRRSVIWMHGLGADGHDFVDIVPALGLRELPVRFVFPHAPMRKVTINQGMVMRAWYDVRAEAGVRREDGAGVREAQGWIEALIAREKARGVAAQHVACEASAANRATPIFFAHGIHDPMIPLARAQHARDTLTGLGYQVEWHEYPMPHSVTDAEVLDIAAWLARILA